MTFALLTTKVYNVRLLKVAKEKRMGFGILESFLIILCASLVASLIFHRLNLPIILGYVLVGTVIGPHVLGWVPNAHAIKELAEFGVALLMFTVGLQFSYRELLTLKYSAFVLGGSQVCLSIAITAGMGFLLGMPFIASVVMGAVVAMSSTAIVIKQLVDQKEMKTKHGLNALGVLLFQDLAFIPIIVVMASLSAADQGHALSWVLSWSLVKGIIAVGFILLIGRWLLRPLLHRIQSTQLMELFTSCVLLIAIGSAWVTHTLGVSYALGAFLAGIMLSESEYRHQIRTEIRPFRDILLGIFFVSIGMLVDVNTWPHIWVWMCLLAIALMAGKMLLVTALGKLSGKSTATSVRTGLVLAQGSEFGFAILTLALTNRLIPADWAQSVLGALLISFVFAPIVIRYNGKIAKAATEAD
jgi:monovalent cation:H+ antiporter-2, CPA2 family